MKRIVNYKAFINESSGASTLTAEQINFLNNYVRGKWNLNDEGVVDVDGDFSCSNKGISDFKGIVFGKVDGDFDCSHNNLTSLEGCPKEVGGHFYFHYNNLTSLEGCPKEVGGNFGCSRNNLTSLEFGPKEVGWDFNCSNNSLTSLEFGPKKVGGSFDCSRNALTTLEGSPKEVGGRFDCSYNTLLSLKGAPEHIGLSFISSEFGIDWHIDEWINLLKEGGKHAEFIVDVIPKNELDSFFNQNPMELDLLNKFPEIKAGVIERTGIKDFSKIAALKRIGMI